ncbi:MAG: AAA family ATPase [Acidobacteria bacterium]|nr:AAA family ATPase [Acidobacteriota bacterium]MCI0662401.1 AAA family ATPase [Acidobacteriota bacterium]
MRIRQISVHELFDTFNYTIPLNRDDHITIIHGPNGSGKTVLLKMLDGLFNSRYEILRATPFKEFRVDFDEGSYIRVAKTSSSSVGLSRILTDLFFSTQGSEEKSFSITRATESEHSDFVKLKNAAPVRFVGTERLLPAEPVNGHQSTSAQALSVDQYAQELANLIQAKLAESAEFSQSLDRTFPSRLVGETPTAVLTEDEMGARFSRLEQERSRLTSVGILDENGDLNFQVPPKMDDRTRSVLSIYLKDAEQKLGIFNHLADKIEFLKKVINRRFRYKEMTITKEHGFAFTVADHEPLALANLSSGEQHELVLLCELLFNAAPGSLILIDEPELSLHVAWQQQFLEDLQEIVELTPMDFLIATHSPDIISDRWDLTVELKGPAQ